MINKETKEWGAVPQFLNIPGLVKDMQKITDSGRGKKFSNFLMALALLKNYNSFNAPPSLALIDLLKKFDKSFALRGEKVAKKEYGDASPDRNLEEAMKRRADPWNFLFIAGMWFQDLFNYDFRRTEMCIIPYATQQGEISFCAYNTGIGWRNIIENMHQNATVAKWYEENGRHEIFARGKEVELTEKVHDMVLNPIDLARPNKPEMEGPKTAHEEAVMMRKLYQEIVLKKQLDTKEADKPVQIQSLSRKKQEAAEPVLV